MNELTSGALLQGGKYRIEKTLGQGGFGITYLAEQELLGRKVCVKEFFMKEYGERTESSNVDEDATVLTAVSAVTSAAAEIMGKYRNKFIKEAKTIARLDHPGIVRIHDVFEENGTAYYVMDYIEGENLNDLVKREGALSEERALGYIRQVADALSYVHNHKIMHLDVKPANIIVRKFDDKAILIDFGTAKQYDSTGTQTSTTPVGLSAGYAPIEMTKPGGVQNFSPETDVYSLGATLFYLVTGQNPPDASDVLDEGLPKMPKHLSSYLRKTVETSMKTRKKRPNSVAAFLNMLDADCKSLKKPPKEVNQAPNQQPSNSTPDKESTNESMTEVRTSGFENGYEWVDLGLSVKWAKYNIGASSPEEVGDYFAWGETSPKNYYGLENYRHYQETKLGNYTMAKYVGDNNGHILDLQDDAGRINWGGGWRIPSMEEFNELEENTSRELIKIGSGFAYKLVSKINSNSVVIPIAGFRCRFEKDPKCCVYWSASCENGRALLFSLGEKKPDQVFLFNGLGLPIRSVIDK